ncbi:exported heme-molybdoenzyme molybdopterin-containing subunit YedY; TAT export [Candidatus Terasakiella magnetica]|nr:exported heme-molybdoenzyme molybdopterin-containing subunit YedY; TAT export [Candidatus Terasakiella magnetica]
MLLLTSPRIREHEITDRSVYLDRRRFLALGAAGALAMAALPARAAPLAAAKSGFTLAETLTTKEAVTGYNNFIELGNSKEAPAQLGPAYFRPQPWSVSVDGECAKPGTIAFEDLVSPHKLEERIYRMRCVEAWSMVIPWIGIPLADVIKRFEPNSKAKYVEFNTLVDPERLPGQRFSMYDWPYVEALRLDEAMNPLALLAVGLYGEELRPQNGAPIRLVVPWKYGFKSVKSIVRIRFTETAPRTTWMRIAPKEYGFYANVNPEVDHPRWSQGSERRIGEFLRRKTLPFNGYAEQVAGLYSSLDLVANF